MGVKDLNKEDFENELIPLFNKVYFDSDKPFLIPYLEDKTEYGHFFNIIYHAAIYKHLCFYKDLELNYEEYNRLFNNSITFETYDGFTYVNYFSKPIIKVGIYRDVDGHAEAIYPLDKDLIKQDIEALALIEKQEKQLEDYEKRMEKSRDDIIQDDEFDDFE